VRTSRLISKPRHATVAASVLFLLVLLVLFLWFISPPSAAISRDRTPPKFAGLESAITCIPGPIGGDRTTVYHLSWQPATDNRTRPRWIVYDIYQATTPGGEDFSMPTDTTRPGRTTYDTPPLSINETFYFVVRARDRAGNSDSNTVERQGENLCE
jgi:hypothetical protein